MTMGPWSESIIVAKLPPDVGMADELQAMARVISHRCECDLIIDLADVSSVQRPTVYAMAQLRRLVHRLGRQFILANISPGVSHLPGLYGHKRFFENVSDAQVALTGTDPASDVGTIVIACKGTTAGTQRRRYRRTRVCDLVDVPCVVHTLENGEGSEADLGRSFHRGRLVDVSQAGALVAVGGVETAGLGEAQIIELSFSPLLIRDRIRVKARVVQVALAADGRDTCIGVEFLPLEALSYETEAIEHLCSFAGRCVEAS